VLVAGSTWPDDEAVLLPALGGLRRDGIAFRLVLAPHGTDEARLRDAERRLDAHGFAHRRWSRGGEDPPPGVPGGVPVLLLDRVGLLRSLYGGAAVAWVGGGFRGELHNVMEPAARGVAVVTGPRTERAGVADPLERAGGLVRVDSAERAGAALASLLGDRERAALAGRRALEVLETRAGATRATVAALERAGWLPQLAAGAVSAR
jgi:3-deoxy-D-manno-octulosonic-acid transferase